MEIRKIILTIVYLLSASLKKKAITKKADAGMSHLNALIAKNACASLYRSCGVSATPAKKTIPIKNNTAAMYAHTYDVLFSLNKDGIKKLDMPTNKKQKRAVLKKKDEMLLMSPANVIYPPNSLKKLWLNEYPTWLGLWILPPGKKKEAIITDVTKKIDTKRIT